MLGVLLAMIGSWVAVLIPVYLLSLIQEPANPWMRFNALVIALSAGAYLYWLWTMGKGSGGSIGGDAGSVWRWTVIAEYLCKLIDERTQPHSFDDATAPSSNCCSYCKRSSDERRGSSPNAPSNRE